MGNPLPITQEGRRFWIESRAYELWVSAGRPVGLDKQFWFQAEAELHAAQQQNAPKPQHGSAATPPNRAKGESRPANKEGGHKAPPAKP